MPGKRDWLPASVLGTFAVLGTIPVVRRLIVPDLNWCYPFMSSDSYDWIANGLALVGVPVESSWRPPGLPLFIGAFWKLGVLSLLPVANYLVLGGTTAILYLLLRERFTPGVAALAGWIFFANDYVQDLTKYVMAEIYCTLFLVLAARAFYRAGRERRHYMRFAVWLSISFLFHHAALIAGVGFAAALLLTRREHLRRLEPWLGLALCTTIAGSWSVARWIHYRRHPQALRHIQEELLHFSVVNVRLYIVAGIALLGFALLPLYVAGFSRMTSGEYGDRSFRATVFGPLLSLGLFWLFLYDWADKRFLYYFFPFCVCLLAEGLAALLEYARSGLVPRTIASAFLVVALLWNQIRYPSYGIHYIALTPRDFLEFSSEVDPSAKTILHITGARVVRLHETIPAAFSRGLFDFRSGAPPCDLRNDSYTCLGKLKRELDGRLPKETPVGLGRIQGFSDDLYLNHNRIGNEILRRTVRPENADFVLTSEAGSESERGFACGPYRLVRRRP